ncbi:MAG: hypothetical protein Q4C78_01805 [Synergistaceae bacterium]|nr:hypothetical protein [Synergistaceae bacterium]
MMKLNKFVIIIVVISCFATSVALADTKFEGMKNSLEEQAKMYNDRLSVLYVGAKQVGDMLLGYKGILEFVMSDYELSENLSSFTNLPNWFYDASFSFSNADMDKHVCFACHVTFSQVWNFDPLKIKIGDYQLQVGDIISPSVSNPFGEFPSGTDGYFVFRVPRKVIKGKTTIEIAYENSKVTWKVIQ